MSASPNVDLPLRRSAVAEIDAAPRVPRPLSLLIQPSAPDPAATRHVAPLQLEEAPLGLEPAGVPAKAPVRGEDAVAGDHDRDGIRAEGLSRGARGLLAAGPRGDLRVRRHVA